MLFGNWAEKLRLKFVGFAIVAVVLSCSAIAQDDDENERQQQTLDNRVASDLLEAYELLENDESAEALEELNQLMDRRGDSMKPFDRASVLQIRGTAHVSMDDYDSALVDFGEALDLAVLPLDQEAQLRFNMGQLNFMLERFEEAIVLLEDWVSKATDEVSPTTYFMLAAAHYNLEQYREGLDPIASAIDAAESPEKRFYDLNNIMLSRLEMASEQIALLERMVAIWPGDLSYWRQLASLYLNQGDQMKSFGTLETAYLAGLIEDESDLVLLAQYYSQFENPHRGAELIEEEMENGRVSRTADNLEMLSQLWSQAREHRKAIPVLQEAAELADSGMLSFRLGQAYLADERNEQAEQAFEEAIDKGGLGDSTLAEAWMLLGNARFNQAGPGDRDQRMLADEAFARATNFSVSRAQAADWRQYIAAINRTESRQAILEQEQADRLAVAADQRLLTGCRAQQLAGQELSEECEQILSDNDSQ